MKATGVTFLALAMLTFVGTNPLTSYACGGGEQGGGREGGGCHLLYLPMESASASPLVYVADLDNYRDAPPASPDRLDRDDQYLNRDADQKKMPADQAPGLKSDADRERDRLKGDLDRDRDSLKADADRYRDEVKGGYTGPEGQVPNPPQQPSISPPGGTVSTPGPGQTPALPGNPASPTITPPTINVPSVPNAPGVPGGATGVPAPAGRI